MYESLFRRRPGLVLAVAMVVVLVLVMVCEWGGLLRFSPFLGLCKLSTVFVFKKRPKSVHQHNILVF